jgi:phosphoribosyl 1,2-cyclic phosphodiesterase
MESKIGKIGAGLRREIQAGRDFYLGDIGVVPFAIPHDAADPVGYRLYGGRLSISTATDLGHFSRFVYDQIAGSDLILLESNHDPDMLRANPHYNAQLKARILGDHGHLSNESCAEALLRLIAAGTGTVLLGHLSGENNTPELARQVSSKTLLREGIEPGRDVQLSVAMRDQVGAVYTIKEL